MKNYPLDITSVGEDTYIVMSKGTYDSLYNIVDQGSRGAWPATYCYEYGDKWEEYNK